VISGQLGGILHNMLWVGRALIGRDVFDGAIYAALGTDTDRSARCQKLTNGKAKVL
jgi:hypothetical protein